MSQDSVAADDVRIIILKRHGLDMNVTGGLADCGAVNTHQTVPVSNSFGVFHARAVGESLLGCHLARQKADQVYEIGVQIQVAPVEIISPGRYDYGDAIGDGGTQCRRHGIGRLEVVATVHVIRSLGNDHILVALKRQEVPIRFRHVSQRNGEDS